MALFSGSIYLLVLSPSFKFLGKPFAVALVCTAANAWALSQSCTLDLPYALSLFLSSDPPLPNRLIAIVLDGAGPVTPIGGLLMMGGWLSLAMDYWRA